MPFGTITSTENTFGTVNGAVSGSVEGTLTGSVGVPGPAGAPGVGVPAGGTSGQFLQKTSDVSYETDWVTVNLAGLATESWVTAGFYPLSGNPSGFLTAASLSGYATESFVTSQGYITSAALSPYITSATATASFYPLSGNPSGFLTSAPVTSVAGRTGAITLSNTDISGLGTLAVVNDAPSDGSQYARKNGAWDVVTTAPDFISSVSSPLAVATGNLTVDLSAYAPLASPAFTGTPTAPTPSPGTDSTQIATTAWVKNFDYAPTNSPTLTGNPKSVTPSTGDNDTSIATTAFVKGQNYITSSALTPYLTTADAASTYFTIASAAGKANLSGATFTGDVFVSQSPDTTNIGGGVVGMYSSANSYLLTLSTGGGIPQIFFRGPTGDSTQTVAYPGPSGFLLKADNLSGLADTSTARTNLGLGTMATATAADYSTTTAANGLYYPLSSNPSSYLVAADIAGKADLASPTFTGTPSLPTGTIGVTQTAGNNTTAVATTAFVQQEVPAASTTVAGKVELATSEEAILGSSTTLVPSAFSSKAAIMSSDWSPIYREGFTGTSSGTGAFVRLGFTNTFYQMPTLGVASGHCYARTFGTSQVDQLTNLWGDDANVYVNFAKRIWISGRSLVNFPNEAVYVARVSFGKAEATGVGNLAARGIGWRYSGGASNFVELMVHDGTTLTTVNSSFHPTTSAFSWDIVSEGNGNVTLYINGSSVATTSAGPSTRATNNQCLYQEEAVLTTTSTSNFLRFYCARGAIYVQR
jgi:hypothetical protein